ncbi:MAG: hypothetical protein A2Y77_13935 [Planctomycetes bacterium RBG_13_62_9]|nr:MAG: hypothetical protein A2Y77_13935 [Planctomycetes bacterium RBG_13_62_9]
MRIAGDPSCNGRAIGPLDRYLSVDLATQKAPGFEKDDLRRFRLRFPSEQKQADVTVALATGQWEVADSWRLGPTWTPYNGLLGSCDRIILRCPEQKDADVVAEVTQVITDRATRLVLFDKDGQRHVSEGEIGGEGVGLVRHIYRYENLEYSQVDRIEFQARPYDYWITFRNVSLAAGYRTQVEVSIKKPGSLLPGSQLPSFDGIEIDLPEETDSRPLLFCFFDLQQRPSRNCVVQLASQSEAFKEKGLTIVAVQTSRVARPELDMWIKDNHISFLVGTVRADEEKTRFTWGVKSLPWLILTDKDHRVCAEGFPVDQLDGILAQSAEIKK